MKTRNLYECPGRQARLACCSHCCCNSVYLRRGIGEAFARLVDRLLASRHYGEQWGRHWLDVTRYADSSGFANDYERGNAWRYRDYVVRSFNSDKPYDQFVREQIAGALVRPQGLFGERIQPLMQCRKHVTSQAQAAA